MKKFLSVTLGILLAMPFMYSQTFTTITENFDDADSITLIGSPAAKWKINTDLYVTPSNSLRGIVPGLMGDTIVLKTPVYNFTGMFYIMMRFDHICKISPMDTLYLEYKISGLDWQTVPRGFYLGDAMNYGVAGFSSSSYYYDWAPTDSTVIPDNSWWKTETFDVSALVRNESSAEFRFVLKRGVVEGTNVSYGWLIDNFELTISPSELRAPIVEFVVPLVDDTVYYSTPYEITAKVKTTTSARIVNPWLVYTATNTAGSTTDSVLMTNVAGDSLWKATIPQFVAGTLVTYSIFGKDTTGNYAADTSSYFIKQQGGGTTGYVTIGTGTARSYYNPINFWSNYNWSRQLYYANELEAGSNGGLITRLAWYYGRSASFENANQTCYFRAVDDDAITNANYEDPLTTLGVAQVWQGTLSRTSTGWVEIILETPFELPPGKNLLVYWHNQSGRSYDDYVSNVWRYSTTTENTVAHSFADNNFPINGTVLLEKNRPHARFYVIANRLDTNSVALSSIDNPTKATMTTTSQNPIVITIQNKGIADLDSAMVYWTVNDGNIDSAQWKGNLPWGFKQQDTVGYFTPIADIFNTLKVWVSSPNGKVDSTSHDDTLSITLYGCTQPLSDIKYIGNGGDFSTIKEALQVIHDCGVSKDITLMLNTGTYPENVNLTNIGTSLNGYSLTITSTSGDAETVTICPASGSGITLNNSDNIIIKNITVDAKTSKSLGIQFAGACTNVVIRECRLLGDTLNISDMETTPPSHTIIHKAASTGVADSIYIINNLIEGGYYGLYFHAGTANDYGNHIVLDSNTIRNWYYSGVYSYYINYASCSYNDVLGRIEDANWMNRPFRVSYATGPIVGNSIINRNDGASFTDPFYVEEYHSTSDYGKGLIANNEIIVFTDNTKPGMGIGANTRADIFHNSIFVRGNGGYGFSVDDSPGTHLTVKNNNFVIEGDGSRAIYLQGINNLSQWDFDYNNMYAPMYIASILSGGIATIEDWKYIITSDKNSISVAPQYINSTENLKVSNYVDILCPKIPSINTDIDGKQRLDITTMGCYEDIPVATANGMLLSLSGFGNNAVPGQKDSLKVIVFNGGTAPINTMNIEWSVNGTSHIQGGYDFPAPITQGQKDTIFIGEINYSSGQTNVEVWINNLNGLDIDEVKSDDTLKASYFVCGGTFSGNIIIADTNAFSSVTTAINIITQCGVSGDITFLLDSGKYVDNIDFTDISFVMGNHSLTMISRSGNAKDVVIVHAKTSLPIIRLNNSNNIVLKAITVDIGEISEAKGIEFAGACTNVLVRDCHILGDTNENLSSSLIYKGTENVVDSIFFINNLLNGGNTGFNFSGGTGSTAYGTNVVFDSNTIINQRYFAVDIQNTDFISCSYNIILSRTTNDVYDSWRGFVAARVNGHFIGNRIYQRNTIAITAPSGFYMSYHNYYLASGKRGLIANNEIMISATRSTATGIYIGNYNYIDIVNNSVYVDGTDGRGIYATGAYNYLDVKNNNIETKGTSSFPISLAANISFIQCDFGYNNMFAPTYVAYANNAYHSDTNSWKTLTFDSTSISKQPNYKANSKTLELASYADFTCPIYPRVDKDINDYYRFETTTMGAYTSSFPFDLMLEEMAVEQEIVNNQTIPVNVVVINQGNATLVDSAVFGWSVNGEVKPSVLWKATNPLAFSEREDVSLGTFTASNANTFDVKIWIESVNNALDSVRFNDTISMTSTMVPLARFVSPLVQDTTSTLSFDVYTKIMEQTGATIQTPQMQIQEKSNGTTLSDVIPMRFENGLWVATVPVRYYGSKVFYSLTVSDTVSNTLTITDSTYIHFIANDSILYSADNLSILSIEKLVPDGVLCSDDYTSIIITLANTGVYDYDFAANPVSLEMEVTQPITYNLDTFLTVGKLHPGATMKIELTNEFPIMAAGEYDVKVWMNNNIDMIQHDDTLLTNYVSGKFGLSVDEDFSTVLPIEFDVKTNNEPYKWQIIPQGTEADTAVKPQFGQGMLAFTGSMGSMSTLSTRQLDLSQTIKPALSFWYFHDTVPCDDYMDVRITIDGGATYTTLYPLTKYDASYGWRQYSADLPDFAVNQCVILAFEAMEKSIDGDVTQYIDRIRITAKQDIAITGVLTSEFSVCEMEDKEWKVVLSNLSDPVLNFANTPVDITLEILGTPHVFTQSLQTDILDRFSSDTITLTPEFDFAPGTYNVKAYFTSILDENQWNDTLRTSIEIKPKFSIEIVKLSQNGKASVGFEHKQVVILENEGNMDLPEIELILSVNLPEAAPHFIITKITDRNLSPGDTMHVTFDSTYTVPNSSTYEVTVNGSLVCAPTLVYALDSKLEEVDTEDLAIIEIVKPEDDETEDVVGSEMEVSIKIENKSSAHAYGPGDVKVGYMLIGSDGNPIGVPVEEEIDSRIGTGDTISFTFEAEYTVPTMKEYTLVVCIKEIDKYNQNDTSKMDRITDYDVNILNIDNVSFTMEQNIPNPAKDKTAINYSIPQDGEILFQVHSINGQLLHSQKENVPFGDHQIELNISDYTAGIYFYTMEYKGQKLMKRMSVK